MPWVEALSDPLELRRRIRDLIALSTLPVIWKDYDPNQIADSVAAALFAMVNADFVYVWIPDRQGEPWVEVLQASETVGSQVQALIRAALRNGLPVLAVQRR